mgnify:FL=1
MKRLFLMLCMLLVLTACTTSPYDSDGSASVPVSVSNHSHAAFQGDNVVEHDFVGYCGNTITTVRYEAMGKSTESWEKSFWGGTSVGLSDFLRWLDYDDGTCRCLPEYYVKTEFSASEYGINLSVGYVRFEGKQVQLTSEQLDFLQQTVDEIAAGRVERLCALPPMTDPAQHLLLF